MHDIYRYALLGLFLAGCAGADSRAQTPTVDGGASSGAVDSLAGPFDPVIEEPLRPLFADPISSTGAEWAACGSMAMAIAPLAVLMLQSLCASSRKRYGPLA